MKKALYILFFLFIHYNSYSVDVSFAGAKFRSAYFTATGNVYQSSDSTYIGYDTSDFKSLIFIKGKVHIDPLQYPYIQVGLGTGYQIYARIGDAGSFQLLDSSSVSNAWSNLNIAALFTASGMELRAIAYPTIQVGPVQFRPGRLFFSNKPPSSGTNSSALGMTGRLLMPADSGQQWAVYLSGSQQAYVTDSGNYLPSFTTTNFGSDTFRINALLVAGRGAFFSRYSAADSSFSFYGDLKAFIADDSTHLPVDSFPVHLGDSVSPGIVIRNGVYTQFSGRLSDNFRVRSLQIRPDSVLSFSYTSAQKRYELSGKVLYLLGADSLPALLGNSGAPGMTIENGRLRTFTSSITRNISIKKLTIDPDTFTFSYFPDSNQYTMYGGFTIILNKDSAHKDSMHAILGYASAPGMIVKNGSLSYFSASITENMKLKGLRLDPDTLTFAYAPQTEVFNMYGGFTALYASDSGTVSDSLHATLGTFANPGVVVSNDTLMSFNAMISGNLIKIRSLSISPDSLAFSYDHDSSQFKMFGRLRMMMGRDTIAASFGTGSQPGLVIRGDSLLSFQAKVTGNFIIDSLNIKPDTLVFSYNGTTKLFSAYGGIMFQLKQDTLYAGLGNALNPGILVKNDTFQLFRASITTDFKFSSLAIAPDSLTFEYDHTADRFGIYGGIRIKTKHDTIYATLGSVQQPGFQIDSGVVQFFSAGITNNFYIDSTLISPDTLTLAYRRDSAWFSLYGGLRLIVHGDTIYAGLGTASMPGATLSGGDFNSLNASVTGRFKLRNTWFDPDTLTFQYNRANAYFAAFGGFGLISGKDTIAASLGNKTAPGLLIDNGQLISLHAGITGKFSIASLRLNPDTLSIFYDTTGNRYGIFGGVRVYYDTDTLNIKLGNSADPGIVINESSLQRFNGSVTGKLRIRSLDMITDTLTFQYDRDSAVYEMFGSVTALLKKDSVSRDSLVLWLGNDSMPGFRIRNGSLVELNAAITDSFRLKGTKFKAISAGLSLNFGLSQYELFGTLAAYIQRDTIRKDSFQLSLGTPQNPGLVIKNSELYSVNASVTAAFKLRGLQIAPQNLTFIYNKDSAQFQMYGGLVLSYGREYMNVTMGKQNPDATWTPGLVLNTQNGDMKSLFFSTTDTFRLRKLLFSPQNLTVLYDKDSDYFKLYGGAVIALDSSKLIVSMGSVDTPGLVIDSGEVTNINIGITTKFKIGGFEIKPTGLTFQYNGPQDQWEMFGNIAFALNKDTIEALLGNQASPGILVQNGSLTQLNIAINSDIKLAKLDVKTDSLGIKYVKTTLPQGGFVDTFFLFGSVSFTELWSAKVSLGGPGHPYGLEIDIDSAGNKTVVVDDLTVELDNAQVGGITLKQLKATIERIGPDDYDIDAICKVDFPAGFEIDGEIEFKDSSGSLQLEYISVDYVALGNNQGIEIGGGAAITELGGSLQYVHVIPPCSTTTNCSPEQDNFQLNAQIAIDVGGQLNLLGTEVQMVRSMGRVILTKDSLAISDSVILGAYNTGTQWKGLVTAGYAAINLNWAKSLYTVKGDLKYPPAVPLVDISAGLLYKPSGLFDAQLQLGLIVPPYIPFIGGDQYASVDGLFRYAKSDPNNSYAAGWVQYPHPSVCWADWWPHPPYPCFYSAQAGVSYNFGTGNTSTLGTSDVANMQNQIANDGLGKAGSSYNNLIASTKFELNGSSSSAIVKIIPSRKLDLFTRTNDSIIERVQVAIIGPMGTQSDLSFYYRRDDRSQPEVVSDLVALDSVYNDSVAFITTLISSNGNVEGEVLPPGEYTVLLTLDSGIAGSSFSISAQAVQFFPKPSTQVVINGSNTIGQGQMLNLEITNTLNVTSDTLHPKVYVYYDEDSTGFDGHLSGVYPVNPNENNLVTLAPFVDSVVVRVDTVIVNGNKTAVKTRKPVFTPGKTVYVYCKIEDGINPPVASGYTNAVNFVYQPNAELEITGGRPYMLNSVSDSLHLDVRTDFGSNDKSTYWVTVYYDLDSMANTGIPVKGLDNIPASSLSTAGYWFKPEFRNLKGQERVFFYVLITDSATGNMYKSYNSAPYVYGNNLQLKYVYGDKAKTPASGIRVAIDQNGNDRLDGHEYAHKTNRNGVIELDTKGNPEVDVVADLNSMMDGHTPDSEVNKLLKIDPSVSNKQTIVINYPGISGKVTNAQGAAGQGIRVYADLNNNGIFDQGTDVSDIADASGAFTLLNVFGRNITIRTDLTGTHYIGSTASSQYMNYDAANYFTINFNLQ